LMLKFKKMKEQFVDWSETEKQLVQEFRK